jgi:hypothetical protein
VNYCCLQLPWGAGLWPHSRGRLDEKAPAAARTAALRLRPARFAVIPVSRMTYVRGRTNIMAAAESLGSARVASRGKLLIGIAGLLVVAVVFTAGLAWAKWIPYGQKAINLSSSHSWSGGTMFADSGKPGALPTFSGAWHFSWVYFQEIWKGFLVALLIAAAFDALVPRAWLLSLLHRRTRLGQAAAGGAAALPSLMCTCCTSPLAVGLRRRGERAAPRAWPTG